MTDLPASIGNCSFCSIKKGGRVLICRLDIDSLLMGEILGLKERAIKAILVTRKNSVVNVLKSLIVQVVETEKCE